MDHGGIHHLTHTHTIVTCGKNIERRDERGDDVI